MYKKWVRKRNSKIKMGRTTGNCSKSHLRDVLVDEGIQVVLDAEEKGWLLVPATRAPQDEAKQPETDFQSCK
jgi:hypothetical protein